MTHEYEEALASNFYFDRNFNVKAVKLLPGEYYVTEREMMLVTVLGSCVAACIRDTASGIGGMNHFMLPENNANGSGRWGVSARYGTYAMEILINHLLKLGASRHALEAKVFGGGNVLSGMTVANIGERNAEFVLEYLATEKIKVAAKDLVDAYPRKVYFTPQTGKVLVKKLRSLHNNTIFDREKDYVSRLSKMEIAGDVEIFN